MRRIDLNEAANFLREHDRFLILMHGSPDGDTVGCGTALCGALQQIGKLARTACPDPLPKKFGYMFRELKEQGVTKPWGHPVSRPAEVEAEAVARYMRIAQLAGTPA